MKCANHPELEAATRCDGCAEPYCKACIVEVQGQQLCDSCKVMVIKNRKVPPQTAQRGRICEEVYYAAVCSVIGLTCCCLGIVMHPVALVLAHHAILRIRATDGLMGIEIARAAQVTSIVGLVLAIFSIGTNLLDIIFMPVEG